MEQPRFLPEHPEITYRYLGFTHHTTLLLPFSISVVGVGKNCS